MFFRKPAAAVTAIALAATAALAQTSSPKTPAPSATTPHGQSLAVRLNLSPDQIHHIQAIYREEAGKTRAVKADTTLSPAARRAKSAAIRQELHSRLDAVLTAAQRAQLRAIQQQAKQPGSGATPLKNP